jgi:molybdate transport system substrate-binding protein
MKRRSHFVMGLALSLACLFSPLDAGHAAELKVFASVALTSVLDQLSPTYEKKTGDKLLITYDVSAGLMKRIAGDEAVDVIIVTEAMINDLQKQGKVAAGGAAVIADTNVSVATKAGAPKPDISSADALKRALLAARSVTYSDPAKGGLSGTVAKRTIDRLGIAEQLKDKIVVAPGGQTGAVVAKGDAELGIALASELVPFPGTQLIGPLPGDLASSTILAGGIGAKSGSANSAKALIDFLTGPDAAQPLEANGFEPR